MQRLFLYHLWACVPFALAWAIWPAVLGVSQDPAEISALRTVVLVAVAYLAIRSWVVLRRPQWGWQCVWPLVDVLLISVALCLKGSPDRSWLSLLYLLPVTEAAATLELRWALAVGLLSAATYVLACGAAGLGSLQYMYAVFRLFFLVLMASLLTHLARTASADSSASWPTMASASIRLRCRTDRPWREASGSPACRSARRRWARRCTWRVLPAKVSHHLHRPDRPGDGARGLTALPLQDMGALPRKASADL